MATMDTPMNDRRHIPDRRMDGPGMNRMAGTVNGPLGMSSPASTGTRHGMDAGTRRMTFMDWIPMLLLMIGGINWGLVGLFDFDLVATLFGDGSALSRVIYIAVGLSALYALYLCSRMSRSRD